RARGVAELLGHVEEVVDRAPARVGDELRRVAGEVPLEELEDAVRILEGLVLLRRLPVLEPAAGAAVSGLLPFRRLPGGGLRLHPLVLPGQIGRASCRERVSV